MRKYPDLWYLYGNRVTCLLGHVIGYCLGMMTFQEQHFYTTQQELVKSEYRPFEPDHIILR